MLGLPRCWACHKWQRHAGRWKGSGCCFGQQLAGEQPSCKVNPPLAANRRQEAIGRALLTRTASCCAVVSPLIRELGQAPLLGGELRSRGMCPEHCRRAEGAILPLCSALQQPQLLCERPAAGVGSQRGVGSAPPACRDLFELNTGRWWPPASQGQLSDGEGTF